MPNAMPPIDDEVAARKERLRHAHDGPKNPRLQMLYLLASGQAHSRHEVAHLLGVHRHTLRRWLALDAAGGLEAVLATSVPAAKPVSLAAHVLASLARALHRPAGLASDEDLRQWGRRTQGVEVQYQTPDPLVRPRFTATRQGARPTPTKQPGGPADLPGALAGSTPAGEPA